MSTHKYIKVKGNKLLQFITYCGCFLLPDRRPEKGGGQYEDIAEESTGNKGNSKHFIITPTDQEEPEKRRLLYVK